jgi:acetyl esterase/lipase
MLLRAPKNVRRQMDVVIGKRPATGKDLLANIWLPPEDVLPYRAAVIYVHGGAWVYGDKDNTQRPAFRHLAGQGYLVMDVAYTLWPDSDIPHMVQEVKQAVLWLKRNSDRYGIDPDHITLSGASAGGHLALLAAYTPENPLFQPPGDDGDASVRAVIAYYPPVDFRAMYHDLETVFGGMIRDRRITFLANQATNTLKKMGYIPQNYQLSDDLNIIRHMLGGSPDEIPEVYDMLSPINHVDPRDPPTQIFQGEDDFFRLAPSLRELHRKLQRTGVPVVYIEFPYTPHGFDLFLPQISPVALRSFREMDRFLFLVNYTL